MRTPWWNQVFPSFWARFQAALARDWSQTQHHFGARHVFDLKVNLRTTLRQILGAEPIPVGPNLLPSERAHRFGATARHVFQDAYPNWCEGLEVELRREWGSNYSENLAAIRQGWESQNPQRRQAPDRAPQQKKRMSHGITMAQPTPWE
jgi:hypothetical protein